MADPDQLQEHLRFLRGTPFSFAEEQIGHFFPFTVKLKHFFIFLSNSVACPLPEINKNHDLKIDIDLNFLNAIKTFISVRKKENRKLPVRLLYA